MEYVDGFVLAIPTANKEAYRKMAIDVAAVFKECGATRVVECWGDDVPDGQITSFIKAVKCEADETVVFSWITWPNREVRDEGMEKFRNDPRMNHEGMPDIFDGKRMIYGGFQMIVDE